MSTLAELARTESVPLAKEAAIEAVRAGAYPEHSEPTYEPAVVIEGEQLYRLVKPNMVIHCFAGAFGADWSLESAEAEVHGADEVGWVDSLLGHNLTTVTHELEDQFGRVSRVARVRFFDVRAPEEIQAGWRLARRHPNP